MPWARKEAGSYSGVYDGSAHPLTTCFTCAIVDSLTRTHSPAARRA